MASEFTCHLSSLVITRTSPYTSDLASLQNKSQFKLLLKYISYVDHTLFMSDHHRYTVIIIKANPHCLPSWFMITPPDFLEVGENLVNCEQKCVLVLTDARPFRPLVSPWHSDQQHSIWWWLSQPGLLSNYTKQRPTGNLREHLVNTEKIFVVSVSNFEDVYFCKMT